MNIIVDTSGLEALRLKLEEARAALPILLQEAVIDAGDYVSSQLTSEAPVGEYESDPPPGDGSGRLNESFYVQEEASQFEFGAAITVRTTQPQKLDYVVNGRGEVRPVVKMALFWKGLIHPVKYAGPSRPNDFVERALSDRPQGQDVLESVIVQLAEILQ